MESGILGFICHHVESFVIRCLIIVHEVRGEEAHGKKEAQHDDHGEHRFPAHLEFGSKCEQGEISEYAQHHEEVHKPVCCGLLEILGILCMDGTALIDGDPQISLGRIHMSGGLLRKDVSIPVHVIEDLVLGFCEIGLEAEIDVLVSCEAFLELVHREVHNGHSKS